MKTRSLMQMQIASIEEEGGSKAHERSTSRAKADNQCTSQNDEHLLRTPHDLPLPLASLSEPVSTPREEERPVSGMLPHPGPHRNQISYNVFQRIRQRYPLFRGWLPRTLTQIRYPTWKEQWQAYLMHSPRMPMRQRLRNYWIS